MALSRIECLLHAIWAFNGAKDPSHQAFKNHNPLCLQVFSQDGKSTGKLRSFSSFHGGFLAALFDLQKKCSGTSRAKLDGENFTLKGLMRAYNLKDTTAIYVAKFLRKAIGDVTISENQRLDYFNDSARAESLDEMRTPNASGTRPN
jgi:hypothetical protein